MTPEGRTRITQASRPFNDASLDMGLPPYARRLDVRATKAAFAAGTLGTVGDDTAREDAEGDVVTRDLDRVYPDDVQHNGNLKSAGVGDQLGCESVLHGSYSRSSEDYLALSDVGSEAADPAEALRQSRLRRWQTIR